MVVISQPATGTYNVRLRGTGTGSFALGALMVGVQSTAVLSADATADAAQQPVATPISTVSGQVSAQTELIYQVESVSYAAPPQVRFDATATTRDALTRLSAAAKAKPPAVLGAEETAPAPRVQAVLSAADAPEDLRATVSAALVDGDADAIQELTTMLSSANAETLRLLRTVTEQIVGATNPELALGLLEQLRYVARSGM
jgi:hypothetical protein